MEPFRFHVYVCTQEKPDGQPCCSANGSAAVLDALRAEVGRAGLGDEVQITTCGSLGLCERGPNLVVYPEGVWYSRVRVEDVGEIVREHFGGGRPVRAPALRRRRSAQGRGAREQAALPGVHGGTEGGRRQGLRAPHSPITLTSTRFGRRPSNSP